MIFAALVLLFFLFDAMSPANTDRGELVYAYAAIDADEIELNYNIPVFKATLTCLNEKVISASGLVSNQPPLERPMVGWPIGA